MCNGQCWGTLGSPALYVTKRLLSCPLRFWTRLKYNLMARILGEVLTLDGQTLPGQRLMGLPLYVKNVAAEVGA